MSFNDRDLFFDKYFPHTPLPPPVPFDFQKRDRLLLIGDSVTEIWRFSVMFETYLTVCVPGLEVEVRNIGKGGETADGFLKRINTECLNFRPTVATVCYGMNDAGYINHNREAADIFRTACNEIVKELKAAGTRVVLASPGCLGRLPSWEFVSDLNGTLDGINTSLMYIRDEAAAIAAIEQVPFVDHFWNLYKARLECTHRFGTDYAICGADDGVHPSWAGHVVLVYGLFQALGFDGNLGNFSIDLATKSATTDQDHTFEGEMEGKYTFTSNRYPFCAEGLPDKDWSARSGMTLVPFNQDFNRMILKVAGTTAPRNRLIWTNQKNMLDEWHIYTDAELYAGVNLTDDFHRNPFSAQFRRIEDLIFQKQLIESNMTWHSWESEGKSAGDGLAEYEAQRTELLKAIKRAFTPVTHNIRLEAIQ
jgi:lysophospholipase L1-like esterase